MPKTGKESKQKTETQQPGGFPQQLSKSHHKLLLPRLEGQQTTPDSAPQAQHQGHGK